MFVGTAYGARDLYLEVLIDGQPTDLIAAFREDEEGRLSATGDELTLVGLRLPAGRSASSQVSLDELTGVSYRYSEIDQTIAFDTRSEDARVARVFEATPVMVSQEPETAGEADRARQDMGLVLNYALGTTGGYDNGRTTGFDTLGGQLDARVSTPFGALASDALVSTGLRGSSGAEGERVSARATRLNTSWSFADTKRRMAYRIGDIVSGGLAWTRPLRLGGAQVARDLSIRPDLVTTPLPDISGTAAVPSSVEVLVNGASAFRGSIPAGPFEIADVPVPTGLSSGKLILEDALGNRVEKDITLAASGDLLAKGLFAFSVEAGLPRRRYGVASFDYDEKPAATATGRLGISDWLTLETHAEGSAEIVSGGVGAVVGLGPWGALDAAVAASRESETGRSGAFVAAGLRLESRFGLLNLRTQRRFGDYGDVASASADCAVDQPFCGEVPLAIDQVSVALGPALAGFETSMAYTRLVDAEGEQSSLVTFGATRRLLRRAHLSLRGVYDQTAANLALYGSISVPLGDWGHASAQFETAGIQPNRLHVGADGSNLESAHLGDGKRASLAISRKASKDGGLGVRGHIERDGDDFAGSLGATYEGSRGRLIGAMNGMRGAGGALNGTVTLSAEGALVLMDALHATRRVDDAFVVVDAGVPGVSVLHENREIGVTGRRGRLLVPGLRGLERNRIAISPDGLPANIVLSETEAVVVPGQRSGMRRSFAVSTGETSALVTIVDETGAPLPVGTSGILAGGREVIVGYDGETWIEGLGPRNTVTFGLSPTSSCQARFPFARGDAAQTHLGSVVCRSSAAAFQRP